MKVVYEDAKYFRDVLKGLQLCGLDEATFQVTPEGLFFKAMDSSRVALVQLELPKCAFYEFEAAEEKRFTVNLEHLVKNTFKNIYKDDKVSLELTEDKLVVILRSDLDREFKVPLLENPEPEELPEPKIAFNCMAKVTVEGLKKILNDAETEAVTLVANHDCLTFKAVSDYDVYSVVLEKGDQHLLDLETKEDSVKAAYSSEWLRSFVKALKPLVEFVEIFYATDMPMRLRVDLKSGGALTFWLAPRIEVEEEPIKQESQKKQTPETEQKETPIQEQEETETEIQPIANIPMGYETEKLEEKPTERQKEASTQDLVRKVFFTEVVFIEDAPSIIGEDLKTYGPFEAGKSYTIPLRNAEIIISDGLAVSWYMWNSAQAKWKENNPDSLEKPSIRELKEYLS